LVAAIKENMALNKLIEKLHVFTKEEIIELILEEANKLKIYLALTSEFATIKVETLEDLHKNLKSIQNFKGSNGKDAKVELVELLKTYIQNSPEGQLRKNLNDLEEKIRSLPQVGSNDISSQLSSVQNLIKEIKIADRDRFDPMKLEKILPKFHGKSGMDIESWLFHVDNQLAMIKVTEKEIMIQIILPLLRDDALQAYIRFQKNNESDKYSWTRFKASLLSLYKEKDKNRRIREELMNLKHGDGSFEKFTTKFQELYNQVDNMNENEAMTIFLHAIHTKTKYEIIKGEYKTLQEVIVAAKRFEECCGGRDQANMMKRVFYTKTYPRSIPSKPKWNKSTSHTKKDTVDGKYKKPWYNVDKEKREKEITCHRCKKKGHMVRDCRVQLHRTNQVIRIENKKNPELNEHVYMIEESCKDTILCVTGEIKGLSLKMALDSGATTSIISKEAVHKIRQMNELKIEASGTKVKTADNNITHVEGITEPIRINVHGHVVFMQFLVMEHEDHDVLLGLDWFRKTGASISPAESTLKFPGVKIKLNNSDNSNIDSDDHEIYVTEVVDEEDIAMAAYKQMDHKLGVIIHEEKIKQDENDKPVLSTLVTWISDAEMTFNKYNTYIKITLVVSAVIIVLAVTTKLIIVLLNCIERYKTNNKEKKPKGTTIGLFGKTKDRQKDIKLTRVNKDLQDIEIDLYHLTRDTYIPGLDYNAFRNTQN